MIGSTRDAFTKSVVFFRYRHPNVIELLGFSEGPGSLCLIYSYMDKRSLEHQLHNVTNTHSTVQKS